MNRFTGVWQRPSRSHSEVVPTGLGYNISNSSVSFGVFFWLSGVCNVLQLFIWCDGSLGEIARQLGLVETLLNLMVDELDEGVVLFRQFLLQNLIVLLAHLVCSLLTHPFADDGHLLEGEDWLVLGPHQGLGAERLARG